MRCTVFGRTYIMKNVHEVMIWKCSEEVDRIRVIFCSARGTSLAWLLVDDLNRPVLATNRLCSGKSCWRETLSQGRGVPP